MVNKLFNAGLLILVISFAQAILFKGPVIVTIPGLIVGIVVLVGFRYIFNRIS
jgi:hypothetical protein